MASKFRPLTQLSAHTTRPENVYHHDWEVTPYDPASGRLMHRTVLLGTESIA